MIRNFSDGDIVTSGYHFVTGKEETQGVCILTHRTHDVNLPLPLKVALISFLVVLIYFIWSKNLYKVVLSV